MAVLACPATGGFHPLVIYAWECNGIPIAGETTPLLYCCQDGMYTCIIEGVEEVHNIEYI